MQGRDTQQQQQGQRAGIFLLVIVVVVVVVVVVKSLRFRPQFRDVLDKICTGYSN